MAFATRHKSSQFPTHNKNILFFFKKNPKLWLVGLAISVPGVQYGWQSVMAIQFETFGVSDTEVANILFLSVLCQAASVAAVGLAMDHFRHRLRLSILVLLTLSAGAYLWLALLSFDVVPYSLWQLFAATITATTRY